MQPASSQVEATPTRTWHLTHRNALTPHAFASHILATCIVLALLGAAFLVLGYYPISIFFALHIVALLIAAIAYALHAVDGEHVRLFSNRLEVEVQSGARQKVVTLARHRTRCFMELNHEQQLVLVLTDGRHHIPLGSQLGPESRHTLLEQLRCELGLPSQKQDAASYLPCARA